MIYNRILNCHLNTSNDPTLLSHHNQKIWKLLVFMPQTQKGPRHEKMNLQQKRKGLYIYIYICKCFSNELNLDHIQQYLDETVKISFDNNKPLMSKKEDIFLLDLLFLKIFQNEIKISVISYKRILKNLI